MSDESYGNATSYQAYIDGLIKRAAKRILFVLLVLTAIGWAVGYVHVTLPTTSFGLN